MHRDSSANSPASYRGQILPPSRSPSIGDREVVIDLYPGFDRLNAPLHRRTAKRAASARPRIWLWAALILIALIAGLVALRGPIVEAVPPLSTAYTAVGLPTGPAGLAFDDVQVVRVYSRGWVGLNLDGTITNPTGRQVTIPSLTLTLRASDGTELQSLPLRPSQQVINPGGSARFMTEIADPPAGTFDLVLRLGDAPPQVVPIN
jgi:hypothetical protein